LILNNSGVCSIDFDFALVIYHNDIKVERFSIIQLYQQYLDSSTQVVKVSRLEYSIPARHHSSTEALELKSNALDEW